MSEQKQQKNILNLYGLFGASIIVSILPYTSAALLSTVFFTLLLIMGYVMRRKAEAESLQANHATFIIRTLWITAFLSLITITLATAYMLQGIDYSTFEPCANTLAGVGVSALETADMMVMYGYIEPCVNDFIASNRVVLMNALAISAAPLMLYMGYRFTKGIMRAMKGYRLANPQSWF